MMTEGYPHLHGIQCCEEFGGEAAPGKFQGGEELPTSKQNICGGFKYLYMFVMFTPKPGDI